MIIKYSNPQNDILLLDILNDGKMGYKEKNVFSTIRLKIGELLTDALNENYSRLCFLGTHNLEQSNKEILKYKNEYAAITGNKNYALNEMFLTENAKFRQKYPFVYWIYDSLKNLDMDYYKYLVERTLLHQRYDATTQQRYLAFNMTCPDESKLEFKTSVSYTLSPAFQEYDDEQYFDKYTDYLIQKRSQQSEQEKFLDASDKIIDKNDLNEYFAKKYQYELANDKNFKVALDFVKSNNPNIKGVSCFEVDNYDDLLKHLISIMIDGGYEVKRCSNCNKYFAPERMDAEYCNNSAPQNSKKTCSEYVKYKKFLLKTQTDESTKLYKQIYNSKLNKIKRCGKTAGDDIKLRNFMEKANDYRKAIKLNNATEQEFIEWLKSNKEGDVNNNGKRNEKGE